MDNFNAITRSQAAPAYNEPEALVQRGEDAEDRELQATIHKMLEKANERELRIVYSFIKALTK